MRLHRHFASLPAAARGAVVAVGNFDGVHRGHQAVIAQVQRLARDADAAAGILTFEPHPRRYFQPDAPPFRLTPFRVKTRLLQTLGLDRLYALPFNRALASLTAEDFVERVLARGLGARHVVVGDNFRFGRQRLGDTDLLRRLAARHGFGVTVLPRVMAAGVQPYSSSHVREQLQAGNPTRAALLLGRYFEIEGRVRHGAKRGRQLGYPTANIGLDDILHPAFGVYAVRAQLYGGGGGWIAGVANIGISPMFNYVKPLLEVHLFDFAGDLYGKHLRVALVDRLRGEMTFDGLPALIAQMDEDSRRAKVTLAWEQWDSAWPASPLMALGTETRGA